MVGSVRAGTVPIQHVSPTRVRGERGLVSARATTPTSTARVTRGVRGPGAAHRRVAVRKGRLGRLRGRRRRRRLTGLRRVANGGTAGACGGRGAALGAGGS